MTGIWCDHCWYGPDLSEADDPDNPQLCGTCKDLNMYKNAKTFEVVAPSTGVVLWKGRARSPGGAVAAYLRAAGYSESHRVSDAVVATSCPTLSELQVIEVRTGHLSIVRQVKNG